MSERRKAKRADTTIPLMIKLLETAASPPPITVETANISPQGLSIVIKIKINVEQGRLVVQEEEASLQMVQYLLLSNKRLKLELNILPQGKSIQATGKVKWYDRSLSKGFYVVRAGILIEEMEQEHKEEWLEFLGTIYQFLLSLGHSEG